MEGLIYLADGTVYRCSGFGAEATRVGELVFNTSMVGYQEMMTDPACAGDIAVMTYPLIGNYGICEEGYESPQIHALGMIVKEVCTEPSNNKCETDIDTWFRKNGVPGVWGLDTRELTKRIRNEGSMKCVISTEGISVAKAKEICDTTMLRTDLMYDVCVKEPTAVPAQGEEKFNVAVIDMGTTKSILNVLTKRGCKLTLFPCDSSADEIMAIDPDGIYITSGPGDPTAAKHAINAVKRLMAEHEDLPIFGVGMGHEILALAAGGQTFKLKYGHHGSNHGINDVDKDRSFTAPHNHSYAVNPESVMLKGFEITHINLNDATVEGIRHRNRPVFSLQFHPEASKDTKDSAYVIDRFISLMKGRKENA